MSKSKLKFEFGQKVWVGARLVRESGAGRERTWKRYGYPQFKPAIYLGYRTIYDGRIIDYGGEYGSDPHLNVSKTHRVGLICRASNMNSEYVFEVDIHANE